MRRTPPKDSTWYIPGKTPKPRGSHHAKTTVTAQGIVCGGCANSIKSALATVPGVSDVTVEIPEKRVTVIHDERVTRSVIVERLSKAGYQPA